MKRQILTGLTIASIVCVMSLLITGCATSSMKGTTYVNTNADHTPMVFMAKTVGVLKFVDNEKVEILFPYAIDTENMNSTISISSEMWISGEYKKTGDKITISFKLSKNQEKPGILEVEVEDNGKTLHGEGGESFTKTDK